MTATTSRAILSALSAVSLMLPATLLSAQSVTLSAFLPGEIAEDDFHISRPLDRGHLKFGIQLHGDYANSPLVYEVDPFASGDVKEIEVVGHQLNATVGLSLGLFNRLVIYGGLPVVTLMRGAKLAQRQPFGITASKDKAGLGNAYAGLRLRLFGKRTDAIALALQGTVHIPTAGDAQTQRGGDKWMVQPELLFSVRPGDFRIVANAGAELQQVGGTDEVKTRPNLTYGLGLGWIIYQPQMDPRRHFDLMVQAYGTTPFTEPFSRLETPLEALGGAKFFHESGFIVGAAGGAGITRGVGSPDARVVAMLAYAMPEPPPRYDSDNDGLMDDEDQCPYQAEDPDQFEDEDGCVDPDDDRDGIDDVADSCRLEPEDKDDFEDGDGCPDPDNDKDGILDGKDTCPNEPEDTDGFEDADGCPDPDNDGDGILDNQDECVDEPGVPEQHGCPESDRDGDTVIDKLDNCPDEPGEVRYHGCKKVQKVIIGDTSLEILEVVYFQSGRDVIQRRSFALLTNVAEVLNAHPEITHVLIEGHTDSRGRYKKNVKLSQRRADAVKRFLAKRGNVEASRLSTVGYGPDRPLVPDARTAEEHARNRRVEFKLEAGE